MILRQVQHLAAVSVVDDAMVLTMMRFADQLVDESTFSLPARKVDDRELDLAQRLIDGLTAEWKPEKYKDDYRENLMRVIKSKMSGREGEARRDRAGPRFKRDRSDGPAQGKPRKGHRQKETGGPRCLIGQEKARGSKEIAGGVASHLPGFRVQGSGVQPEPLNP